MKHLPSLWSVLLLALVFCLGGCKTELHTDKVGSTDSTPTLFYILRHAEKEAEGDDPGLTAKGNARATLIAEMFSTTPLDAIYSTPFLRNSATVEPLAKVKNLEITIYDPKDTQALLQGIFENHPGGNVLIVGHSNTVPGMLNTLIWEDKFENLSEDEYQRLFILSASEHGKGTYSEMYFEPKMD
jgi:2,3-bisphosphoglycerate-dependent phosphoglycerate mutase